MIRNILAGAFVCALALGTSYFVAQHEIGAQEKPKASEHTVIGLQYKKVPAVNVPVIAEGVVKGYVVAGLVFTADSDALSSLSVPVDVFVRDEAFRYLYADPRVDFRNLSRYPVNEMIAEVRTNVNKRLGSDVVRDILLDNVNFVDKSDVAAAARGEEAKP
jgi:flagellar basal body-associated protein FliL